jgi:hypothetical protein
MIKLNPTNLIIYYLSVNSSEFKKFFNSFNSSLVKITDPLKSSVIVNLLSSTSDKTGQHDPDLPHIVYLILLLFCVTVSFI